MKEQTLKQLAQWCGGKILPEGADAVITGMQHDSRALKSGELFVAIAGERFDGHNFLSQARNSGAAAALVSRPVDDPIPQILVEDTLKAFGDKAVASGCNKHIFCI